MQIIKHLVDAAKGKHPLASKRSDKWPETRAAHLKLQPVCQVCGGSSKLEVHHIHSFVEHPELELDPSNLITLCEARKGGLNCHLVFGHLSNFQQINPNVQIDSKTWNGKMIQAKLEMLSRKNKNENIKKSS